MKTRKLTFGAATTLALFCIGTLTTAASADEVVTVDSGQNWLGFMSVSDIVRDINGNTSAGASQFSSAWGFNDLTAEFAGSELVLGPNSIDDPSTFWYVDDGGNPGIGNKWMDASGYVEVTDGLSGMNVTFEGNVIANTFTDAHTGTVFIRDFAPDFSSFNEVTADLNAGAFSISLDTEAGAGRHVQYGFNVQGENVWVTDRDPFGTVRIAAVPEPASASILLLAGLGMVSRRRR